MRFYRRDGRYLIRRPPQRRHPNHVSYSEVRNLWLHVARIREAAGDHEGAARARQSAVSAVRLSECVTYIVRVCPQCRGQFLQWTSLQQYCSKRCRQIHTSPTHWLPDNGWSRAACGNSAYWAPLSINPDDVTCGNCRRHSRFEEASFAQAWKISSAGW